MWIDPALCIGYGRPNEAAFAKSQLSHERFKAGFGNGQGIAALDVSQWAINQCGDIGEEQASGTGSGRYPVKNDDVTNCMPTYQD